MQISESDDRPQELRLRGDARGLIERHPATRYVLAEPGRAVLAAFLER